jgi:hypothetical protein
MSNPKEELSIVSKSERPTSATTGPRAGQPYALTLQNHPDTTKIRKIPVIFKE